MDETGHHVTTCKKCKPGFYQDETGGEFCKSLECSEGQYVPSIDANLGAVSKEQVNCVRSITVDSGPA